MANITVKLIGGPLDGRVEERDNARPITYLQLDPTVNPFKGLGDLSYNEFQYWLIPKLDGTWEAFEKPVWDAIQAHILSAEEKHQRIRRRAHEALDRILSA